MVYARHRNGGKRLRNLQAMSSSNCDSVPLFKVYYDAKKAQIAINRKITSTELAWYKMQNYCNEEYKKLVDSGASEQAFKDQKYSCRDKVRSIKIQLNKYRPERLRAYKLARSNRGPFSISLRHG